MYVVVTFDKGRKKIRADYHGGAYIDLSFGTEGNHPTEVINVYDYGKGSPEPPFDRYDEMGNKEARLAVRTAVEGWIREQREDWPTFYEDYLANAY